MTLITQTADLAAFCQRQSGAEFVAVDTEFMRDKTYWPQLCLVQVAGPDEAAAIDSLAPDIDLQPLYDLLTDTRIVKVFHAARQDMEVFYHLTNKLPAPIVDTQVAAMVCGFGDSVSYETLATKLASARIDKSSRFTDWARRPLSERQLAYALSDVTHLRLAYEKLRKRIDKAGRHSWFEDEMAVLTDTKTYRADPQMMWRRLKVRSDKPRFLALLRELAAWREEEAQRRNLPRNRVIKDEVADRTGGPCAAQCRRSQPWPRPRARLRREQAGYGDPGGDRARARGAGVRMPEAGPAPGAAPGYRAAG